MTHHRTPHAPTRPWLTALLATGLIMTATLAAPLPAGADHVSAYDSWCDVVGNLPDPDQRDICVTISYLESQELRMEYVNVQDVQQHLIINGITQLCVEQANCSWPTNLWLEELSRGEFLKWFLDLTAFCEDNGDEICNGARATTSAQLLFPSYDVETETFTAFVFLQLPMIGEPARH